MSAKATATSTASATAGGMNLGGWLTLAFVVLKLTGFINWSWWWVFSPLWISGIIAVIMVLGIYGFVWWAKR